MNERELFGPVSACESLLEAASFQTRVIGDDAQRAVAAFAMVLGSRAAPPGEYREDALRVLDCLGMAKLELDKSSCHTMPTVFVTAAILADAQKYVDDMTIPCTEWPTSDEVVSFIFGIASKYAFAGPWRRTLLGPQGQVVGVEEFDSI
jgi:hypothetical protein